MDVSKCIGFTLPKGASTEFEGVAITRTPTAISVYEEWHALLGNASTEWTIKTECTRLEVVDEDPVLHKENGLGYKRVKVRPIAPTDPGSYFKSWPKAAYVECETLLQLPMHRYCAQAVAVANKYKLYTWAQLHSCFCANVMIKGKTLKMTVAVFCPSFGEAVCEVRKSLYPPTPKHNDPQEDWMTCIYVINAENYNAASKQKIKGPPKIVCCCSGRDGCEAKFYNSPLVMPAGTWEERPYVEGQDYLVITAVAQRRVYAGSSHGSALVALIPESMKFKLFYEGTIPVYYERQGFKELWAKVGPIKDGDAWLDPVTMKPSTSIKRVGYTMARELGSYATWVNTFLNEPDHQTRRIAREPQAPLDLSMSALLPPCEADVPISPSARSLPARLDSDAVQGAGTPSNLSFDSQTFTPPTRSASHAT